jgi:hypothetical protein
MDTFELTKEIEKIYNKTSLFKEIKRNKLKLSLPIILPLTIFIITSINSLLFVILKNDIICILSMALMIISIVWFDIIYKKLLQNRYGIFDNSVEILFYKIFKQNLFENKYLSSKDNLEKIEKTFELELKEEYNYLNTHFISYITIIVIPIALITLEEYIKQNIQVLLFAIFFTIAIPSMTIVIKYFVNRKIINRHNILRKIKRILIEI